MRAAKEPDSHSSPAPIQLSVVRPNHSQTSVVEVNGEKSQIQTEIQTQTISSNQDLLIFEQPQKEGQTQTPHNLFQGSKKKSAENAETQSKRAGDDNKIKIPPATNHPFLTPPRTKKQNTKGSEVKRKAQLLAS